MKRRILSFLITLALCLNLCPVQALAADERTDDGVCPHHPIHTEECGYVPEDPGALCTFACRICPVEDLIGKLPGSVSENNIEQVQDQLSEIYDLYEELTADEQEQVDLSPCMDLLSQLDGMEPMALSDESGSSDSPGQFILSRDYSQSTPYEVVAFFKIRTNEYTFTGTDSTAILVKETGELYLSGTVASKKGAGVEVQSGGFLSITEPETFISGTTCALNIASGARVHLSAGRYTAKSYAIRTEDVDLSDLLESGYAYFDSTGNLLLPEDAAKAKTIVIDQCTDHSDKTYTHTSGTTTHTWNCPYCGVEETEKCRFTFNQDGTGICDFCENTITITVTESGLTDLVYDGTLKPGTPPPITVTLGDGSNKELVKDADYEVDYTPQKDAGEITVTVTGITFNGTFTKTYHVEQDQPGISWDKTTETVDYSGSEVSSSSLPNITITIKASEDLHQYLQYFYRKTGETEFTAGLPTNAGTYEVKAYIPESQNYKEAVTDPYLTLTIKKIPAVTTVPTAKTLTYNREAQELVTAGVLKPGAAAEGAKIEYKLDGAYSTDIPTSVGVSSYNVYYRVADTENYSGVSETLIKNPDTTYSSARINHKEIKPTVELEYKKTMYTGEIKEPKFTVKDGDYEIPKSEYTFKYNNNRNVGTATLTVNNASNGNYKIIEAKATFEITSKPQDALTITQKPNSIIYGDQFTLGTQGGSGSGHVTWEVTVGSDVAEVDGSSGQVTIIGDGEFTVKATKSGKDPADASITNYDDATASWTVKAEKKKVTATVTAEDKTYDGDNIAVIHAVVEQGVLPGDEITITGLTGTFDDENAGVNKTVTVTIPESPTVTGKNSQHYAITYSSTTVKATINKAIVHITTPPDAKALTYSGDAQALIDDSVLDIDLSNLPADLTSVLVEYALSKDGLYSTDIPEGINAGAYTVWYRVQETSNYTGEAPASVDVTIKKKPVTPTIALDQNEFVYDGNAKEPVVTLTEDDGTIPADQYTVSYSKNVNVGTAATVTVTAKADGNYTFTNAPVTAAFEIKKEQAKVLTAPEAAGDPLYFRNSAQKLVTAGTGYGGKMVYSLDENGTYSETIPTGISAKDYTVYYKVEGDSNHSDSNVGHLTVTIAPKTVNSPNLTIELRDDEGKTLVSYTYDGNPKEPTVIVKDGSTVIDADKEYNVIYRDNTDAGRATVEITDKPGGNYTVTGSATFVIVKADIVFAPAPSAADITYDGKSHELLVPGTTSGGEVLYALNTPTGTYTAAIPTATEAGGYTVWYKVTGDKNHNDLAAQSVPVTIQRKPLTTITIELSPAEFAYDGKVKLPEVSVWDGKTKLSEEEYSWSCDTASPTNVGTYTITISDKADGNYDLTGVTNKTATFTIGQISQDELVIGGKPAATNYGDSFQLTVSGGKGNGAVTWEATGSARVDTTDGNVTITITDVGEATVTVKKAADTNYLAAEAQWTFTAAPRPVTATVEVANRDYDGTTDATVASASITTETGDTVTIDLASITATFDNPTVGEGKTVTLDASKVQVTGATAKYAISYPETVKANITQATTSITKAPEGITSLTYDGQPQALVEAGKTNVGFIVYSLDGANFSPEIPTGTNAGTYNVYYKVDGTADYTDVAVNENPVTVTIKPKEIIPVIELSESSYLYDGTKKEPKITVKDGKTVIDEEQYTVTWTDANNQTVAELTVAGTYTATIENVDNGNYTFSETVTVEIVAASQGAVKITGKPDRVCYGDIITTLDTTGGIGNGTVTWSITAGEANSEIDPATGKLTIKDTGSITVKAERTVPNYAPVSDTWTFTVEPKPVTAEVVVEDKTYDGSTSATVKSVGVKDGDLVNTGDSITITGLTAEFEDANAGNNKTVTLKRSDPGFSITADTAKYTVSIPATAQAKITPRALTTVDVTLSDHDLQTDDKGDFYTYDGNEKKPAVTVEGSDETGYNATLTSNDYTVDYAKNKNAGTADVIVTAKAGGNYTFADETVNFEIRNGAAVLTKTPEAKDLTYDGTAQDLVNVGAATGGTVVYSLKKENENEEDDEFSYSETIPQGTEAGIYTVYYKVQGDGNHDDTTPGQVSVTIKPREITAVIALSEGGSLVTASTYTYDGNAKTPDVTVTGGVNANPIATSEYTVFYYDNTNAGTAKVIVSDANGGNYIVNGTATFEIGKAVPTVTAPTANSNLKYNGSAQELITAGEVTGGTMLYCLTQNGTYSTAIPTGTAVGGYTIWYKIQGDLNYSDVDAVRLNPSAAADVTIAKNTVNNPTITLSSDTFKYNGGQQKPTITVFDDNSREIPASEYTATITTTDGDAGIVSAGTYTVTITTPENSNYVITTGNTRTFEIVPADQETISITGTQAKVQYGDVIQLGITGGIGGSTVKWEIEDKPDGSKYSSTISATGLLTVKDADGPIRVKATRTADNHKPVSATWEFTAAKKQVTAVVTADDRPYVANNTSATVHVSVPDSELVSGDSIKIEGVTGSFGDPNVGTNKKVTVKSTNPDVSVTGNNAGNYEITYPATTTASITAVAAMVTKDPEANTLTYDASQAQELVTAGEATGGIMVYSLDGANFTPSIPKAKDAGTYTVYFKAQGDGNHTDSEVKSVQATIGKQSVTPQIELSPTTAKYDGEEHTPTVTLWDGSNNVIPTSEYKVTYVSDGGKKWIDKGDYTIKIENIDRGNYIVATITEPFTISTTAQNPLEITNKPGLVYYGDTFTLSAVGGSGNAAVTWSVDNASVVDIDANGLVKIIGVGSATIKAEKAGGTNYETATATYPLNALAKPITAIVTADDKVYDGATPATTMIHVTWNGLVGDDTIDTSNLVGAFADEKVGTNKTVNITGDPVSDATSQKYVITIPRTTTASILKADTAAPAVTANNRKYDSTAQPLVTGGDDNTRYSDSRDGVYSANVPTGTNAGAYTVWYKELGDDNHNDSAPQAKTVTISRKELETPTITLSGNDLQKDADGKYSYVYDGTEKKPTVTIVDGAAVVPASEYTVGYSDNKNVSIDTKPATITIISNEGGNYTFTKQTVTFKITSAAAQLTKSPEAKDLTYTGQPQELVTVGTVNGGHLEYKLDNGAWGPSIPKAERAGTYTVTYKVVGDGNYVGSDDTTWTVSVTIKPKEVISPKITMDPGPYTYTGNAVTPTNVKVEDGDTEILTGEYRLEYRNNINAGKATVVVINENGGDYIVNGTADFTITKANDAKVDTAPDGKTDLQYSGSAQELVIPGEATGGTLVYALDEDGPYSPVIPTGTAVGTYTVWYKVQGDENHEDTTPVKVVNDAVIGKNVVTTPTIQVTPEAVTYDGKKQNPTVTIKDNNGVEINGSEYTTTFKMSDGNTDLIKVGTYNLTITATGGNYDFSGNTVTATFEILPADQTPLTITGTRERVYYGDMIHLGTTGGANGGTIEWKVEGKDTNNNDIATLTNELLTINSVGSVTVTATCKADGYNVQTATWPFYADPKPVTAVVTAANKPYDSSTTATVTAELQENDLVGTDKLVIKLAGDFEDANAGKNKKVIVDSSNPTATVDSNGTFANYNITYPAMTTASITKVDIDTDKVTLPKLVDGPLEYTGDPQALVEAGIVGNGIVGYEYSTDGLTYFTSLPTGTNAGDYGVWYRVKGDGNHNDIAGTKLNGSVTIVKQKVEEPTIEFNPGGATYDSREHKPTVIVKDSNGRIIPDTEYTVTYEPATDWIKAGDHTVKVENNDAKTNGNYNITAATKTFTILPMGQTSFEITDKPGKVYYGDSFTLSTTGGSGTGAVTWSVTTGTDVAHIDNNGLVTLYKSGTVVVQATKASDGGYASATATWTFEVKKKPVEAIVTANDKPYDGEPDATLEISWKSGDVENGDKTTLTNALKAALTGTFKDANVGTNKTVDINITGPVPTSDKYEISYNTTTRASITPAAASVTQPGVLTLTYNGQPQPLVSGGTATSGTIKYSLDGIIYGPNPPSATNAGTYTVWYKVEGNANYADVAPQALPVTISPKTLTNPTIELSPESFDYDGSPKKPDVTVKDGSIIVPASEYTVSYSNNTAIGTNARVTITNADGGNYIVNGSATFTIKAGNAVLTVVPRAQSLTYDGTDQELVTEGVATNGKVIYCDPETGVYSDQVPTAVNAGTYKVYYKVQSDNGISDTAERSVTVTIKPKPVKPSITLLDLEDDTAVYTGSAIEPTLLVRADGKRLIEGRDYEVYYRNNKNVGRATVMVWNTDDCNYEFDTTVTFEIVKEAASFAINPVGNTTLVYTGEAQDLIATAGTTTNGGIIVYSLDGVTYSALHPTGTEVKTYTIYAKILGNSTCAESDVVTTTAVISKNPITADKLTATLSPGPYKFTGSEIKPTVTLTDDDGNIIPADEYKVDYSDNINVGEATVTITSKGNNYAAFTKTEHFQITEGDKPALTITGKPEGKVCYGDTFTLSTTGGSDSGTVQWSATGPVDDLGGGQFKITSSGKVTITATKGAATREANSVNTATWEFYAYAKPITAIVTAKSKPYDGDPDATSLLTVTLSGLLSSESVTSVTATGQFVDTNVGTQTVIVTLNIPDAVKEKYDISYPATVTANITAAEAKVTKDPTAKPSLQYTGAPLELVDKGEATGGKIKYSLDGETYTYAIPTGKDAKSYTVWYKVVADDGNYKDSKAVEMAPISIAPNTEPPNVECKSATFTGKEQTPTVIVTVNNRTLPKDEYEVKVTGTPIAVGDYTVTVTDKPGGNYEFSTPVTATFQIVSADQNPVSIVNKPSNVCYGDTFRLSATGGSGNGAIEWKIAEGGENVAEIDQNGEVKVIGTGEFTVEAYRKGVGNYGDSNTDTALFVADKKTVTPTVTAENKSYNGNTTAKLTAKWKDGDLVNEDTLTLTIGDGAFETADVGTNKTVTFRPGVATGDDGVVAKYDIKWPESTTASIYKVNAELENRPEAANLTFTGQPQPLLNGGTTVNNIGTIVYSTSQYGVYSTDIPTGTTAGPYTVWYKVADSVNYTGIPAAAVEVEIAKADPGITSYPTASSITSGQPLSASTFTNNGTAQLGNLIVNGTFAWANGDLKPEVGTSEQDVIFTPNDTGNYNPITFKVEVTVTAQQATSNPVSEPSSTPANSPNVSTPSSTPAQTTTTIRNSTARTTVSATDGNKLVQEAAANKSQNVVIKPEITGDVTKTEVSIPSSTVSRLSSETDAALTVSSPVADVTISNTALDTLSRANSTVSVTTEQVEQSVVVTLAADGETVEEVPGGLTLTVPAEDAGPGTVAVLVHEDGTRETIRKSVATDGAVSIPLNGSATVEIVDNSKDFDDVPPESWAADAVDFASSHELFSGTSETTFSPDQAMSRGMLATVLYRLEGSPEMDLTDVFSDVGNDAWYAEGVAWAVENGIADGYGDGQFGPEDSITREQFVVMLWRYAGSPEASSQTLDFADADQVSDYAQKALCWAVENGILHGAGSGVLDPGGTATRAQVAQLLKNFMENT